MIRYKVGIALGVLLALAYAISEVFLTEDQSGQDSQQQTDNELDAMLLAGSGDNIWVSPERWERGGQPPAYLTDPHYVTPEDLERDMYYKDQRPYGDMRQSPGQQSPGSRSGRQGVPTMPYGYSPLPATPYGAMPGFSVYPGMGHLPGYGMPYGNVPGFGGNPLLTPFGSGYWYGLPDEQSKPSPSE